MILSSSLYIGAGYYIYHHSAWDEESNRTTIKWACITVSELTLFCTLSIFVWKFIEAVNMCHLSAKVNTVLELLYPAFEY